MANFKITTPTPPRFDGDFKLGAVQDYQPGGPEAAYCDAVNAAVDTLAADERADAGAKQDYSKALLADRQAGRLAAADALRRDAIKFIGGQNAAADVTRVTEIGQRYATQIPKFGAKPAAAPRFDGDFDVIVINGYTPGSDEQAFLDAVTAATTELAHDKAKDARDKFSPNVKEARKVQRADFAEVLTREIEHFGADGDTAKAAAQDVVLLRGRYQARRDRLTRRLFNVTFETKAEKDKKMNGPAAPAQGAADAASSEDDPPATLDIRLLGDLPPPEDKASPDKLDLYVQITKTNTVIRTVCDRLRERGSRPTLRGRLPGGQNAKSADHARRLHVEFLEKLHGVAVIGLELNFVDVARLTLTELRNEFFALEAGRIKSAHSNSLALWAFSGSAILLAIYAYIDLTMAKATHGHEYWLYIHRSFLVAACGAAIGAWCSFSVRQVQFVFEDLVMLEERTFPASMRILFVVVLTMAACLLFWNGAVNIEIGDLKTKTQFFRESGAVALLIGLFCGLSERALATAIAGRAASFVKTVGGGA